MSSHNRKLFLVDAMALIYRAHFGLGKKAKLQFGTTNTAPILGFINTLLEVLDKEKPQAVIVAMDSKGPTFREQLYKEYKAHRDAQPEAITEGLPYIEQFLKGFHIPILVQQGYEADDLIGTTALHAQKEGWEVYLLTTDKDFGQLVSKGIFWYKPGLGSRPAELFDQKRVCERWGLQNPKQLIDLLGLWGDSADNIPGVKGIGEKRAQQLLQTWGTIESIYEHLEELTPSIRAKLKEQRSVAMLSKRLATIQTDVPIQLEKELFQPPEPSPKQLLPLFKELGFTTLTKRVFPELYDPRKSHSAHFPLFATLDPVEAPKGQASTKCYAIKTKEELKELTIKLEKATAIAIDTETDGLVSHDHKLIGIAISYEKEVGYYIPVTAGGLALKEVREHLLPLLESSQILKIGHNLKYDISVLEANGLSLSGPFFDTMIAHQLLKPDARHTLSRLSYDYLGHEMISIESLIGKKGKQQRSMQTVPLTMLTTYAGEDAAITLQLYALFSNSLQEEGLNSIFYDIEMPLLPVLVSLERIGVKIDEKKLNALGHKIREKLEQAAEKIYALAGIDFNINSPKQLGMVLFEKMAIMKQPAKTKNGQYATSEAVLNNLQKKNPIIPLLLSYRAKKKLLSTYIEALPTCLSPKDDRIHTSYNQAVVSSGRLSSSSPNLQNIPIKTEEGRAIRSVFIAEQPNSLLLSADYSQIELRLMAHFSQDPTLLKAFQQGEDIHTATAIKLFGCSSKEEVTPALRRKAKTVNFGIIYGISAYGLSQNLSIARKEAQEIIDAYFLEFPKVKTYIEEAVAVAKKKVIVKH